MFFTQELLSRRDSGFGLLWLAATLGAKSSFKKLPRRSVVTADISELCTLIAEPPEPLALRLSSNLMIGVARVYKVKQEIFLADVTTCFHTLKKAVQDIHANSAAAAQLQMGQPSVRPDLVTVVTDPTTAFALDFDHLLSSWDDRINGISVVDEEGEQSDDEYDPTKKSKKKGKAKDISVSLMDNARVNLHTLKENHDVFLSASFDVSFNNSGFEGVGPSSSQINDGFGFNDNFLEGMDVGGDIGDELALELGEGWGAPSQRPNETQDDANLFDVNMDNVAMDLDFGDAAFGNQDATRQMEFPDVAASTGKRATDQRPTPEVEPVHFSPYGSVVVPLSPLGADCGQGNQDENTAVEVNVPSTRKTKRVRLLLDARTELTNEELQRARAHYMEEQAAIREEMAEKKAEKEGERLIEELISGAPRGLNSPMLVDFWLENFRLQVEARSGQLTFEANEEHPRKRKKTGHGLLISPDVGKDTEHDPGSFDVHFPDDQGLGVNADTGFGMDVDNMGLGIGGEDYAFQNAQDDVNFDFRLRSSEEPGQARRASSRPPSMLGSQFGFSLQPGQVSESQRSSMFPWDNAGAGVSSSVNGAAFDFPIGSDRFSASTSRRPRGSSLGRLDSPLHPVAPSPGDLGLKGSQISGEDFEFDVPAEESLGLDSQLSETNIMTLERHSYNFLEYAKMQLKTFPVHTSTLSFDDVVPKVTSTPHVAAAAFYHCLVLATKNLIGVGQVGPFGDVKITVK